MSSKDKPVILSGVRTPFGKYGGGLMSMSGVELGGIALREAMQRADIDRGDVTHNIMGCVVQAGMGQVPSRQAAFKAGLGREVTSDTINRVCASGMRAVTLSSDLINMGHHRLIVAGGMESMSNAPYYSFATRWGARAGNTELVDGVVHDGLTDPLLKMHMILHGSNVAAEEKVSREEQDKWALRSHQRVFAAIDSGTMAEEIVPVIIPDRKKGDITVAIDEAPRRDTTLEALAKLKPVFDPNGSVTPATLPASTTVRLPSSSPRPNMRSRTASSLWPASSATAKPRGTRPISPMCPLWPAKTPSRSSA